MKLAIMQPYLFPYIGYFQLINAVDKFVFFDDVNFINRGWINRNRILINREGHLFTIPLKKKSQNKQIREIEIFKENDKILKTIKYAYSKAPYFKKVFPLIQQVFDKMDEIKNISKIAEISVIIVSGYLNLSTLFETSSDKFALTRNLAGEERLIAICQQNLADICINSNSGRELYNKNKFRKKGIQMFFIKNKINSYKQFNNDFIPDLSIIDVMMFNDKKKITTFLNNYELE